MDDDPDWARRVASREINRRRINEAIERGRQADGAAAFVCECGRLGCNTTLELPVEEYESVRTDFDRFLLVAGHDLPPVDLIVERRDGYCVVVKQGEAAQMADAADPRSLDDGRR